MVRQFASGVAFLKPMVPFGLLVGSLVYRSPDVRKQSWSADPTATSHGPHLDPPKPTYYANPEPRIPLLAPLGSQERGALRGDGFKCAWNQVLTRASLERQRVLFWYCCWTCLVWRWFSYPEVQVSKYEVHALD